MENIIESERWRIWKGLCELLPKNDLSEIEYGDEIYNLIFNKKQNERNNSTIRKHM